MSELRLTLHRDEIVSLQNILKLKQYRNKTPLKLTICVGGDGVTRVFCQRNKRARINVSDKHVL